MLRRLLDFFKYIFFGEDLKSDILFLIFIFGIYGIIQITFPYLLSVVMSPSMEHYNFNCNKYLEYNITCEEFKKWPFPNGINKGDVVIILPVKNPIKDVKEGDVILYQGLDGKSIMHRIIKIVKTRNETYFVVMGDNNPGPIIWQKEDHLDPNRVIGKVILRIPYLGLPKVWLTDLIAYIRLYL